jgi:hypothetical protein
MLIIGIILLVVGFVIIFKGAFFFRYQSLNSVFYFIAYTTVYWFDKLEYKVLALLIFIILGILLNLIVTSSFTASKEHYIMFNIEADAILDILEQISMEQDLNSRITNHSILLDDSFTIKVKPLPFHLNSMDLSEVNHTDLFPNFEDRLTMKLDGITTRRFPLFGAIVFCFALALIILFYRSIL